MFAFLDGCPSGALVGVLIVRIVVNVRQEPGACNNVIVRIIGGDRFD